MALRATLGHESRAAKDTDFRFLYVTFNGVPMALRAARSHENPSFPP
jgi:hypothetical protein